MTGPANAKPAFDFVLATPKLREEIASDSEIASQRRPPCRPAFFVAQRLHHQMINRPERDGLLINRAPLG